MPPATPAKSSGSNGAPTGSADPELTVAGVARRLGVAPATLRTWDRRYGLGPSERAAGAHRRYTRADLARLQVMRRLTLDGVAPVDAARIALVDPRAEDVGVPIVTRVVDAIMHFHDDEAKALLRADGDPLRWWSELVRPVVTAVGQRPVLARGGEDPAVLVHAIALAALRAEWREAAPGSPLVLVIPEKGRPGDLAWHAMAASLNRQGCDARVVLGPVDQHHLAELIAMASPDAVVRPRLGTSTLLSSTSGDVLRGVVASVLRAVAATARRTMLGSSENDGERRVAGVVEISTGAALRASATG